MDYEGQRLVELIFYVIIISAGAVAWVIGYIQQDFMIVFKVWLAAVFLSVLVRVFVLTHKRYFCLHTLTRYY